MGGNFSVRIESPPFVRQEWTYLPEQELREDYGYYRVLQNKSTGQKIDQYQFIWPNEEEFNYYLKSYNWRYNQSNVVSTKFIDIHNKDQFCSSTYTARVYIEHIRVRLSDIRDIPYPDNLYVLMEALEGYSQIYEHSKFFYIEENQICVDDRGNIKIWVNGDLSINYPNLEGQRGDEREEDMVDMLINLIADNTDPETEPEPTFKQYYDQKKGVRGKNFEQARVLIMSYARVNNIQIPSNFESVLSMDHPEQEQLRSFTQNSHIFSTGSELKNRQSQLIQQQNRPINPSHLGHHYQEKMNVFPPVMQNQGFNQAMSFGNAGPKMIGQSQMSNQGLPFRPVNYIIPNQNYNFTHQNQMQIVNPHPVYHNMPPQMIINGSIVQHSQPMQPMQIIQGYPQPQRPIYQNPSYPATQMTFTKEKITNNQQNYPIFDQVVLNRGSNSNEDQDYLSNEELRENSFRHLNIASDDDEDRDKVYLDAAEYLKREQQNKRGKMAQRFTEEYDSEERGVIARSLPINPNLKKQTNKDLGNIVQTHKAVQSHIDPTQMLVKKGGFDLGAMGRRDIERRRGEKDKYEKHSLKYFSTLESELEIDPEIAADIAKYVT